MKTKTVILKLTLLEAEMLDSVAGNGWGDGDFASWLGNRYHAAACQRAMRKLCRVLRDAQQERQP